MPFLQSVSSLASGGCRSAFCLYVFVFLEWHINRISFFFFLNVWLIFYLESSLRFIHVVVISNCLLSLFPFPFDAEYGAQDLSHAKHVVCH